MAKKEKKHMDRKDKKKFSKGNKEDKIILVHYR
jgi:hypothetical protein